jgi:hypothetical protein
MGLVTLVEVQTDCWIHPTKAAKSACERRADACAPRGRRGQHACQPGGGHARSCPRGRAAAPCRQPQTPLQKAGTRQQGRARHRRFSRRRECALRDVSKGGGKDSPRRAKPGHPSGGAGAGPHHPKTQDPLRAARRGSASAPVCCSRGKRTRQGTDDQRTGRQMAAAGARTGCLLARRPYQRHACAHASQGGGLRYSDASCLHPTLEGVQHTSRKRPRQVTTQRGIMGLGNKRVQRRSVPRGLCGSLRVALQPGRARGGPGERACVARGTMKRRDDGAEQKWRPRNAYGRAAT